MRFLDSKTDVDRAMQQCMRFSNLDTLEKQVTEWQEGVGETSPFSCLLSLSLELELELFKFVCVDESPWSIGLALKH
jgi:hypothetical protein